MTKYILRIVTFILLTILTQIGGIVYLISLFISEKIKRKIKFKKLISFVLIYTVSTFLIVPFLAPLFGKVKIENSEIIKPTNYWTIILNRNYVTPELNIFLKSVAKDLNSKQSNIEIRYLDANVPFFKKFPLLPHLSHYDGRKIDLSFIYENENGEFVNLKKSRSGYGVFVEPKPEEINQTDFCNKNGYFQYDYPKYLTFGEVNKGINFSEKGTRTLILSILKQNNLDKLFIEPNLKKRMNLTDDRIRFQGCRSVRHDDHIHLQIK